MKRMIPFALCLCATSAFAQMRLIPHLTRSGGGFTTDLIIENLGVGQNTPQLKAYNTAGEIVGTINPTLDSLETRTMAAGDWFPNLEVSHVAIEGLDVRVTAAYRADDGNPSPAHVPETSETATRYRLFVGNWDVIFDGLAIVNTGSAATDVRISQKTADGEERSVVLAASQLVPMGKALFVLGAPNANPFESIPGAYYEVYASQPLAITAIRGNFPGSDFLWVNPVAAQNLAITKVTNDAPEKTDCSDFLTLGDNAADVNNMPQAEVMMDISEDGRLAAGAKDYRYGPTDDNTYNIRVWSGLYTSSDQGVSWQNTTFDDSNPDKGLESTGPGHFGQPVGEKIQFYQQSDPVLGFDRDGNLYTNALLFSSDFDPTVSPLSDPSAQIVTRMDKDGNVVPGTTHFIGPENDPELFNDKNWIAVDRDSPVDETIVVLSWRLFVTANAQAQGGGYIAVTANGSQTWSAPVKIPIEANADLSVQFYQPLIGKDAFTGHKTLYIFTRTVDPNSFELQMHFLKVRLDAVPAGDTEALAGYLSNPANWTYMNNPIPGLFAYGGSAFGGNFRFSSYYMPTIDRETGDLFVVASVFDPNTQGSATVIVRSADGGVTWTAPKTISYDNPSHQIFPTAASHSGTVTVIWYDTRHDDSFTAFSAFAKLDVYYAELDYNLNVLRVDRLTKKSQAANIQHYVRDDGIVPTKGKPKFQPHDFNWAGFIGAGLGAVVPAKEKTNKVCQPYGFVGDYIGMTADEEYAYMTWCDLRDVKEPAMGLCETSACDGRRNQNIYFAKIRKTKQTPSP